MTYEPRPCELDDDPPVEAHMLFIGGSKTSYRCHCACNIFVQLGPEIWQCNVCGERYESK